MPECPKDWCRSTATPTTHAARSRNIWSKPRSTPAMPRAWRVSISRSPPSTAKRSVPISTGPTPATRLPACGSRSRIPSRNRRPTRRPWTSPARRSGTPAARWCFGPAGTARCSTTSAISARTSSASRLSTTFCPTACGPRPRAPRSCCAAIWSSCSRPRSHILCSSNAGTRRRSPRRARSYRTGSPCMYRLILRTSRTKRSAPG